MTEQEIREARIEAYKNQVIDALMEDGPNVYVVEAYAACISIAVRLCAMLEADHRSQLCDIIDSNFRRDVEDFANGNAPPPTTRIQ